MLTAHRVTVIKLFVAAFYSWSLRFLSAGEEICISVSSVMGVLMYDCCTTTNGVFDSKDLTAKPDLYIGVFIADTFPMDLYHSSQWDNNSSILPITQFSQINWPAGYIYSRCQSVDFSFVFLFCRES